MGTHTGAKRLWAWVTARRAPALGAGAGPPWDMGWAAGVSEA